MGVFKLGGMTLKSLFKKAPTRKYPYETREPFERSRGSIEMIDIKSCIFCSMCAKKCPADCIEVDKKNETWTHYPYKCIACDACVRACPKSVLASVQVAPPITTKPEPVVVKPEWTAEEIAEKERKEAEKKAKIEAALAAKKAKEAAAAQKDENADA